MNEIVKTKRVTRSKEVWQGLRELWEANPSKTYSDIAAMGGCTKQAVSIRAQREGWTRESDVRAINRRAMTLADQGTANIANRPMGEVSAPATEVLPIESGTGEMMRANVLKRHRREWDHARSILYHAVKNKDIGLARLGKTIAEGFALVHVGERKAWQLDDQDQRATGEEMKIVIERV